MKLTFQSHDGRTRCACPFIVICRKPSEWGWEIDGVWFSWASILVGWWRVAAFESFTQSVDQSVVKLVQAVWAADFGWWLWWWRVVHELISRWTHDQWRLRCARIYTWKLITRSSRWHMMQVAMRWGIYESIVCSRRSWQRVWLGNFSIPTRILLGWYWPTFYVCVVHLIDVIVLSHERYLESHCWASAFFFLHLNNFPLNANSVVENFPTKCCLHQKLSSSVDEAFLCLQRAENRFYFHFCFASGCKILQISYTEDDEFSFSPDPKFKITLRCFASRSRFWRKKSIIFFLFPGCSHRNLTWRIRNFIQMSLRFSSFSQICLERDYFMSNRLCIQSAS